MTDCASDFVIEATISELQQGMCTGEFTCKDVTLAYLNRIAKYDKQGPNINSVLELNPQALVIAEALDKERAVSGRRGPLHGIPILLKDNIDTGDRMHTSAGTIALANSYAAQDAFLVRLLRKAGAVILGKANMSEMAKFVSKRAPNGYSSRGGFVRNPYGPANLDVGGSSCGSGAAVAANLTAAAIGTETLGSIINPSVENSIVGLNPSVGLISRTGIVPIAPTHDTAGPMTRTVEDAAILLASLIGVDHDDPSTTMGKGRSHKDYTSFLIGEGLQGARIGLPKGAHFPHLPAEHQRLIEKEIDVLIQLGASMIEVEAITPLERQEWDIQSLVYEFKPAINHYLNKLSPFVPVHSLKEMIAFNDQYNKKLVTQYGQDLLIAAEATSGTLTEPEYIMSKARDLELARTNGIDAILIRHQLDAILSPGHDGVAAPAKAGYASITVPAGFTKKGEPTGITFFGGQFSEPTLIKLAYAYEQATKHRRPPQLSAGNNE
ncbi:amidase family protein [Paenibacillus xerothermodurans]|uniref:Amidase n=1 Tax=Paenibacillus xerothermodurans TaxID=1977292 RepID=A0A2W1NJE1_PAEXE|nr:amidase family protein [Paenibacillus xerothermodurans]PZE19645.1 amidase [Paenibacillus xerothermodurans]